MKSYPAIFTAYYKLTRYLLHYIDNNFALICCHLRLPDTPGPPNINLINEALKSCLDSCEKTNSKLYSGNVVNKYGNGRTGIQWKAETCADLLGKQRKIPSVLQEFNLLKDKPTDTKSLTPSHDYRSKKRRTPDTSSRDNSKVPCFFCGYYTHRG